MAARHDCGGRAGGLVDPERLGAGWSHPPGSNLVAWTKQVGASPIAYLQSGDGPVTYADADYRRIVGNAIQWAAGPA